MIQFILVLIVVGVIWALVNQYLPMPPIVNTVIMILFVIIVCLFLLQLVGVNVGHGIKF